MKSLLSDAAARAINYVETLPTRPVSPDAEALDRVNDFVEALPQHGTTAETVLAMLDDIGTPASVAMSGPRYFGFVIGGVLPASLAVNWLATAWDQNSGIHKATPAVSTLERVAIDWLVELLGLPSACGAGFVTGATVANFTALAAARHQVLANVGWDVESDGLFGAPPITVICSEESHPSVTKSLGLLGFGRNRVSAVPVDREGRIRADKLPAIKGPTIVCAQVGNVNTGSCDPMTAITEHAKASDAWVHVDGAFGLWLAASGRRRQLIAGVEHADSWATDAHKWLNVPYDSGIAFVRNADTLRAAMAITAAYLPMDTEQRNPSDYTPELSRRARGVEVWAAIKELGADGVGAMIDRCCDHALSFAEGFRAAGYQILNEVVMNQVLVSFGDSATTEKIIKRIQEDGTCWCGITVWQGRTAMRISVCNWSTTDADVAASLEAMLRIAHQVINEA